MKKTIVLLAVSALLFAMAAPAMAADFIGGGGDDLWSNANNWSPVGVPTLTSGPLTIKANADVQTAFNEIGGSLAVDTGAELIINADFGHESTNINSDVTFSGIITQNGGDVYFSDDMRPGGGTHNLNGGTFVNRDYYRMDKPSTINITGGSFTNGNYLRIFGGTIKITGDAATLITVNSLETNAASTLDFVLKDGGITTFDVTNNAALQDVTLNVTLDADFWQPPIATDYDLIVAGSLSGVFGTVNLPSEDWSISYVDGTTIRLSKVATVGNPTPNFSAGDDWITWLDEPVTMNGTVTATPTSDWDLTDLEYSWVVSSEDDPKLDIAISNPGDLDATVTVNKNGEAGELVTDPGMASVEMTLTVTEKSTGRTASASSTIDVYETQCEASLASNPQLDFDLGDLNEDCITDFEDFVLLASVWLEDYALTEPTE